ncbi:PREDICTED: protein-glutamate O-methyltransferase [Drosophila arizonae]|uniref:Sugar phosphate phosphatase n=1 Tax=Drosophila arizonae TaxID=7263 RepID=A0ABM1PH60_DROAR|nr:PREDICTED: protein-glutamate O-methyltransferase [Drosophila arizonae]
MEPAGEECILKDRAVDQKTDGQQNITKVLKSDFDAKYNILDISTPLNNFLSAHYKRSYAYYSLLNILPVVLTKVIDSITKDKNEIVTQFGENAREELKIIIGLISRLKYELQTDKPFQNFTGDEPDRESWNNFMADLPAKANSFYQACMMHTECYMYRKLYSFVENSIFLKQFDYFAKIKQDTLDSCQADIVILAKYTRRTENTFDVFNELLKINLWSTRNDLSKNENGLSFNMNVLEDVTATDSHILINDAFEIWQCLNSRRSKKQCVDFVLADVGYELFADFILAEYIIEKGFAAKVRFHAKACPWFVTNTTRRDFEMTLQYLSKHSDYNLSLVGNKFLQFMDEGKFELAPVSTFWTGPHAFHCMKTVDPKLYKLVTHSKLIIFKGDVNYRKLLSDVSWQSTQDMKTCAGAVVPNSFCTIRTAKSEIICGLPEGTYERLQSIDSDWMVSGSYGTIQFVLGTGEYGY